MKKIFVAGHRGMVGAAIVRQLENRSDVEIVTRTRAELDLTSQHAVSKFFFCVSCPAGVAMGCGSCFGCFRGVPQI